MKCFAKLAKHENDNRNIRVIISMVVFAAVLMTVGFFMQMRMRQLLNNYMESQVASQAHELSRQIELRFNVELRDMETLAAGVKQAEQLNSDFIHHAGRYLFPAGIQNISAGLLTIDGRALYGVTLDYSAFTGIQDSFRGNASVSFCEGQGLLFTVPVFHDKNVRYVFYRLYSADMLIRDILAECFEGEGNIALIDIKEREIVPFREYNFHAVVSDPLVSKAYRKLQERMNVAHTASVSCGSSQFMLVAEIAGYSMYLVGFVPEEIVSGGLSSLITLVIWVFALLLLLLVIGIAYLFNFEGRARESDKLRMAKLVAENASKAKSDFLAQMSHEIRTPINAVLGMNEMILRECGDENLLDYSRNIQSAGRTLLNLINDILDFSKIEEGKMEIVPVEYETAGLINDLVSMVADRAESKGLLLELDIDPALPKILYGDDIRVHQIITNLLTNAVKYTEKGRVTLRIHFKFKTVEEEKAKQAVLLDVAVEDTGIGIREEDIGKLFISFQRLDLEKNRSIEGSGLGISIVQQLLVLMGSELKVSSVYGKGSVFSFSLVQQVVSTEPVGDSVLFPEDRQKTELETYIYAPQAKILIVDDYPLNLKVAAGLLKRSGVKIDTAESGMECLEKVREKFYDIIFLDHMMPVMDGIETLHQLKEQKLITPQTTVIMMTANAIAGAREAYLQEGFDNYLSKPIEISRLESLLQMYLPEESVSFKTMKTIETVKQKTIISCTPDKITDETTPVSEESQNVQDDTFTQEDLAKIKELLPELAIQESLSYCMNSKSFYLSIVADYANEDKEILLSQYLAAGDMTQYETLIHALKGISRAVGLIELGNLAETLQHAAEKQDIAFVREHHADFVQKYLAAKNALRQLLDMA